MPRKRIVSSMPVRLFLALSIAAFAVGVVLPQAEAAPTSSAVSVDDWEFDFRPGPLRLYIDPSDNRAYWYFTYTVINRTERDRTWVPMIELFTDEGQIMPAGKNVSSRLTKQLRTLLKNPLLEEQNQIIGDLRVGRENARSGLAVWPANRLGITELTLFVRGISSDAEELTGVAATVGREEGAAGKGKKYLYKTLRRVYEVPGNPQQQGSKALKLSPRMNRQGPECDLPHPRGGCWIYR
jgi:hypothetical protein